MSLPIETMEDRLLYVKEPIKNNLIENKAIYGEITLNEGGFSEPVGTFNSITREAVLTKEIVNKTLIIEVGNVILYGNNLSITNNQFNQNGIEIASELKDIIIKDLKVTASGVDIRFEGENENIKIKNVKLFQEGFTVGIAVSSSRNILVEECEFETVFGLSINESKNVIVTHNKYTNNSIAILLNDSIKEAQIVENVFTNCEVGVNFLQNTIKNKVIKNKFFVTNPLTKAHAFSFGENNSFNVIEENLMIFENIAYDIDAPNILITAYLITFTGEGNNFNDFNKNKCLLRKNNFILKSEGKVEVRLYGVADYFTNTKNIFLKNLIECAENKIDVNGAKDINIFLINMLIRDSSCDEIKNNCLYMVYNNVSINSGNLNFETDNIYSGPENKCVNILENKCWIIGNDIKVVSEQGKATYMYKSKNINLSSTNYGVNVYNNELVLKDNTVGENICINLIEECCCCEIYNNEIKDIEGSGIVLQTSNSSNVICRNTVENVTVIGIELQSSNTLNIIKSNYMVGKEYGILLLNDNTLNFIVKNLVKDFRNGLVIGVNGNSFNTVEENIFCNNVNILYQDTKENYIYDNKIDCDKFKKCN